jgi:predicted deacetylase
MYDHTKDSLFEACGFDRDKFTSNMNDIMTDMVDKILSGENFKLSTVLEKIYHRSSSVEEAVLMSWIVSSGYDEAHRARRAMRKHEKKSRVSRIINSITAFLVSLTLLILALYWFTDLL